MNSCIHQGTNSRCPFCKRGFAMYSGVSHHRETGSCPKAPKVNRESLYKFCSQHDASNIITKKQLDWKDDIDGATYEATNKSWNGYFFECYICHRLFDQLNGLNQHLNSPIHKSKLYKCLNRVCNGEFTSLAGLFSHLESEGCGFMRFHQVQQIGQQLLHSNLLAA